MTRQVCDDGTTLAVTCGYEPLYLTKVPLADPRWNASTYAGDQYVGDFPGMQSYFDKAFPAFSSCSGFGFGRPEPMLVVNLLVVTTTSLYRPTWGATPAATLSLPPQVTQVEGPIPSNQAPTKPISNKPSGGNTAAALGAQMTANNGAGSGFDFETVLGPTPTEGGNQRSHVTSPADRIVVDGKTYTIGSFTAVFTVNGQAYTYTSGDSTIRIGSTTLSVGGSALTAGGRVVTLGGGGVVLEGTTISPSTCVTTRANSQTCVTAPAAPPTKAPKDSKLNAGSNLWCNWLLMTVVLSNILGIVLT